MSVDDVRHAWAVLGLRPGSTLPEIQARHRLLAKRWHPDRFMNDAQGQSESATQMRAINAAYRRVLDVVAPHRAGPTVTGAESAPASGRRLSREEIDRLVASLGTESWVDTALNSISYARARERLRKWAAGTPRGRRLSMIATVGLALVLGWLVIGILG